MDDHGLFDIWIAVGIGLFLFWLGVGIAIGGFTGSIQVFVGCFGLGIACAVVLWLTVACIAILPEIRTWLREFRGEDDAG